MRFCALALSVVAGVLALVSVQAQAPSGEEAAIRAAIERLRAGEELSTPDLVFFSGAYQRPFVRGEGQPELVARLRNVESRSDRIENRVRRIEIAASGDLAYEFSDGTVARRSVRNGREDIERFDNSTLRVWKKVGGRWLVAAHFSARHGDR